MVGFQSVLWTAVGTFVIVDSGSRGVILVMVLDLHGNQGGASNAAMEKNRVCSNTKLMQDKQ